MTSLRAIVERHLRAFNERDFDAWNDLLDEDVESWSIPLRFTAVRVHAPTRQAW